MADYSHIPEISEEQLAIERRRKIAEAMMQRGDAPIEAAIAGGRPTPVSPFQGFAKLAEVYLSKQQLDEADKASQALPEKAQKVADAEFAKIQRVAQGAPEGVQHDPETGAIIPSTMQGAVAPGDYGQVVQALMASRLPQFQQAGTALYGKQLEGQAQNEQFSAALKSAGVDPSKGVEGIDPLSLSPDPMAQKLGAARQSVKDKATLAKEALIQKAQDREDQIRLMAGLRPPAPEQPLESIIGPDGKPVLVSRRDAVGKSPYAKPLSGSASAPDGTPLSYGQKAVDKKFADEYVDFKAAGGYADTAKGLGQLRNASSALGAGDKSLTGPVVGQVPDFIRAFTNPDSMATRDNVEEIVQRNLRLVLGAQFTQKEGEKLIARTYNEKLEEGVNKKRVDALINQIELAARAKEDASRYYEENGTLAGWKGKLYTPEDFNNIPEQPSTPAPVGASPPPGFTVDK